jgi:YD repeat-containing protein
MGNIVETTRSRRLSPFQEAIGNGRNNRAARLLLASVIAAVFLLPNIANATDTPRDIVAQPKLKWHNVYMQTRFDSPEDAFAAAAAYCRSACTCPVSLTGPHPLGKGSINGSDRFYGGSYTYYYNCDINDLRTTEVDLVVGDWYCPTSTATGQNWTEDGTGSNSASNTWWIRCRLTLNEPAPQTNEPAPQTCPKKPTVGDPTYPETGVQEEVEADYRSANGLLDYVRTYRSDIGSFVSPIDVRLADYSPGSNPRGCINASYVLDSSTTPPTYETSCLPLMPDMIGRYSLTAADGRQITFVGSPTGTAANANVNDRLTQTTDSSGAPVWRSVRANNTLETYSTAGALIESARADGKRITYRYSDATTPPTTAPHPGLLIGLKDPYGRELQFFYTANGRLDHLADPAGGIYQYGYDAQGNLASVTYPDSYTKQYHYNESAYTSGQNMPHMLTGITDENSARYGTYAYDTQGRTLSTIQSGGANQHSFAYNPGNQYTLVTDPLGTQRYYRYDTLFGMAYPRGHSQPVGSGCGESNNSITYDTNGNVKTLQDFKSQQTTFTYDLTRNLETQRVEAAYTAQARTVTTTWHPDWRLESRRAEPKKLTTWVYNGQPDPTAGGGAASCAPSNALLPDGKPMAVLCKRVEQATTDATGASGFSATVIGSPRTWTWTYNAYGQVLTANGPRTDVTDTTTYTYYGDTASDHTLGDLYTVKDALGHITTYTSYDKNGRPLTIVDPNSLTTTLTYFPRGWLKTRQVGSELTTYDYDGVGQLKKVTAPDLSWIGYDYDPAHRLTDIYDNLGNRITYTLDNAGNRTREDVTDPGGTLARTQTRVYDALSRLQNIIQPE